MVECETPAQAIEKSGVAEVVNTDNTTDVRPYRAVLEGMISAWNEVISGTGAAPLAVGLEGVVAIASLYVGFKFFAGLICRLRTEMAFHRQRRQESSLRSPFLPTHKHIPPPPPATSTSEDPSIPNYIALSVEDVSDNEWLGSCGKQRRPTLYSIRLSGDNKVFQYFVADLDETQLASLTLPRSVYSFFLLSSCYKSLFHHD